MAPAIDVDLVNFYVEEIRQALTGAPSDPVAVINQFGPMFVVSRPRKVIVPLSETGRLQLLQRFVLHSTGAGLTAGGVAASKKSRDVAFAEHLEGVVRSIPDSTIQRVIRLAKP